MQRKEAGNPAGISGQGLEGPLCKMGQKRPTSRETLTVKGAATLRAGYGVLTTAWSQGSPHPPCPVVPSLQPAGSSSGRTAGKTLSSSSRVSPGQEGRLRCCRG